MADDALGEVFDDMTAPPFARRRIITAWRGAS